MISTHLLAKDQGREKLGFTGPTCQISTRKGKGFGLYKGGVRH